MGFIYLNKFTYLNTFMNELTHRCSDNGGPTVPVDVNVFFINVLYILSWH